MQTYKSTRLTRTPHEKKKDNPSLLPLFQQVRHNHTHTRQKKKHHHHHHHVRRCLLRESRRSDDANAKFANEKSRCKSTGESVVFQR